LRSGRILLLLRVTTDPECPRISIMVPGGRKELVKRPALPFGKSVSFHVIVAFLLPLTSPSLDARKWCRDSLTFMFPGRCAVSPLVD
jgi:hypothetical protein